MMGLVVRSGKSIICFSRKYMNSSEIWLWQDRKKCSHDYCVSFTIMKDIAIWGLATTVIIAS